MVYGFKVGKLMPIYDYLCPKCRREMKNVITTFNDAEKIICSRCDVEMERRFPLPSEPKVKGGTKKFHS